MNRKNKQAVIITFLLLIIVIVSVLAVLIKKISPSKEVMDLETYYNRKNGEVVVILQNSIYEKSGILIDGSIYLDYETVVKEFNKRFYWDTNENLLIFTTPHEVIKAEVGSKDYYINKSKNTETYAIVKTDGDAVYIALDFVKKYSDLRYEEYDNPKRVVIEYKWGDYLYSDVKKNTNLRVSPSIKSSILAELKVGETLTYIDTNEVVEKGFVKVITKDGIVGYVKSKHLKESFYETVKSDFREVIYSNITKDYTINLVWHQVTNQDANNGLIGLLEKTKGVTTVSPTWFSITDEQGNISSLANESYVERAHSLGVEVWGLVDDFNTDVNMFNLLSFTSKREKLMNELIANAIKYNLDGINIDFEKIALNTGIHYIQFIRELGIKCRNNGIVLSIDNYVPMPYSAYYDRQEQGIVADYVIIMAYDEHHASSEESGSVSSINYVQTAIENTLKIVPKEKTIIAIPFYTRLWKETKVGESTKLTSEAYAMRTAENLLKDHDIKPVWNEETKQYYGEFSDEESVYKIWLEEEESIEAKMKLINEHKVAGVAAWKLGLEKDNVWNTIIKYVN